MKTTIPRRALSCLAAAAALLFAPAMLTAQVSLATVVDLAQRNSNAVKIAQTDLQKAHSLLAQAQDAFIPSLTIGSTVGYSKGFPTGQPSVANATMQSLVLSAPQHQYILAARAGVDAANLALKEAREQVALDAATTYIELEAVDRELDAAHHQEAFAARLVEIAQQRAEAGIDPESELLQTQLTAAELKLKRLHLETRAATVSKQLAALTGLPVGSIVPDRASIPEIPAVKADSEARPTAALLAAGQQARAKQMQAHGDELQGLRPQIGFGAQYNLDSNALNDYTTYFKNFTPNNISFGFSIQLPIFDLGRHAKIKESAAEALRARVEAEEAQRQNDVQIAMLTGSLRELDTLAEIASLKQQIAAQQIAAVKAQLELGNGAGSAPGAPAQLSPKAEQLALIEERQKFAEALDASLDLSKTRLNLLRALGHMEDWLHELRASGK
jgi:outer membrane protein TolC